MRSPVYTDGIPYNPNMVHHVHNYTELVDAHRLITLYDLNCYMSGHCDLISLPVGPPWPRCGGPAFGVGDEDNVEIDDWGKSFLQLGQDLCSRLKVDFDSAHGCYELSDYISDLSKEVDDARRLGVRTLTSNFNLVVPSVDLINVTRRQEMYSPTNPFD
jgi:hypothetical protein